jgi:hypothetical protein
MQTARRLYVYLMTGIGLGVLVFGLRTLLAVLLEQLGLGGSDPIFGDEDATREQLTLASALISVSLPVWLIHWFVAERGVRPGRPTAEVERNSVVRGLYFALAMGLLLIAGATAASSLLVTTVLAMTGGDVAFRSPAQDLAMFAVAGAAWAYHVAIRNRDWGVGPIEGAAAFLPRGYLYVAAFVGLIGLLTGVNGLIELIGRLALDEPPAFAAGEIGPWWAFPLANALAGVVVGGAVWLGHSLFAERLRADTGWRGRSERPAKVRLAYFVAVIVSSVAAVTFFLSEAGRGTLGTLLGVSDATGLGQQAGLIVLPTLSAITFAVAWLLHQRRMREEAASFDSTDRMRTADRLALHAPALVGLVYASVGVAWLLGLLIDVGLGGGNVLAGEDFSRRQLAQFLPIALFGTAVWLWSWNSVGARYRQAPAEEASATTRRVSLLLVLAGGILAGIASLGVILYRLFGSVFGIEAPANVLSELSVPIGSLIVATAVAAYHGLALRRDQALRAEAEPPAPEVAAAAPTAVVLRLVAPHGTDADAALAALRERLPAGFVLEVMPPTSG